MVGELQWLSLVEVADQRGQVLLASHLDQAL